VWPADPLAARRADVETGAALVRAALRGRAGEPGDPGEGAVLPEAEQEEHDEEVAGWAEQTRLLLAERAAAGRAPQVVLPAHLSASRLALLARDPDELALVLRRPLPRRPLPAAGGPAFRDWLEQRFSAAPQLDLPLPDVPQPDLPLLDLPQPGAQEDGLDGEDVEAAALAQLQRRFLASEWAGRRPVAVAVALQTPVADLLVRARLDAVFRGEADGRTRWDVVGWRSGSPPTGEAARARDVQLAVHRLAWSRWRRVPLADVGAASFHAATGETVRPVDLLGAGELEALVRSVPLA
ncbi:ATP-dependent helicase, partial [Kineococcus sp. T13]|nr:ATP-dependent helicase [Kineococcus vitellinus]